MPPESFRRTFSVKKSSVKKKLYLPASIICSYVSCGLNWDGEQFFSLVMLYVTRCRKWQPITMLYASFCRPPETTYAGGARWGHGGGGHPEHGWKVMYEVVDRKMSMHLIEDK